jgi:thiamine biosynthesis lipoprotein
MGGPCEVQVCAPSPALADRACDLVVGEVQRIEAKYSRYRPDSLLSRINASAGAGPFATDVETEGLLDYAQACFDASGGLFDLTSGVLRHAWKFHADAGPSMVPSREAIERLLARVGWQRIRRGKLAIELPAGMELDFGGIGKEYAVDRACTLLLQSGIGHALVNLGGALRAIGPQAAPDCSWRGSQASRTLPWRIGIADPRTRGSVICTVVLESGALATSGDYERFIEIDGRRYCHILDPGTAMPVTHWRSVSVVAPLCITAGSASTIAMLKQAGAAAFLDQQGFGYLAVRDGEVIRRGLFASGT